MTSAATRRVDRATRRVIGHRLLILSLALGLAAGVAALLGPERQPAFPSAQPAPAERSDGEPPPPGPNATPLRPRAGPETTRATAQAPDPETTALEPPTGARIVGFVRDERGIPIEGATLTASPGSDSDFSDPPPAARTVSRADGSYTLAGLDGEDYRVEVSASEHVSRSGAVRSPASRDWTLQRTFTIRGTITAPEGLPQGLRVEVSPQGGRVELTQGRFQVSGLAPGRYRVSAHAKLSESRAPLEVEVRDRDLNGLELSLERGREVTIRVRDDRGQPLAGARVTTYRSSDVLEAVTGAEGRALLQGVRQASTQVSISLRGHPSVEVQLEPGRRTLEVTIDRLGVLQGRLLSSAGAPLSGLLLIGDHSFTPEQLFELPPRELRMLSEAPQRALELGLPAVVVSSDEEGRFSTKLPAKSHRIWSLRRGSTLLLAGEVLISPGGVQELQLRLPAPRRLRGRVLRRGRPRANAKVRLYSLSAHLEVAEEATDAEGRFEIAGLFEGRYRLSSPGVAPRTLDLPRDASQDLTLSATGPLLAGRVTPAEGLSLEDATVHVLTAAGERAAWWRADPEFQQELNAPGTYVLIAAAAGQVSKPQRVVLKEAQELRGLVLELERGGGVDLKLAGSRIEGALVAHHEPTALNLSDLEASAPRGLPFGPTWIAIYDVGSHGESSLAALARVVIGPQIEQVALERHAPGTLRVEARPGQVLSLSVAGTRFQVVGGTVPPTGRLEFRLPPGRFEVAGAHAQLEVTLRSEEVLTVRLGD